MFPAGTLSSVNNSDLTHFCRRRPFAFAELVFIIFAHHSWAIPLRVIIHASQIKPEVSYDLTLIKVSRLAYLERGIWCRWFRRMRPLQQHHVIR